MLAPADMALICALRQLKTPRVFTRKTKSQSSTEVSVTGAAGTMTPAMLTAPSSLPNFSTVWSIQDWTEAKSCTSTVTQMWLSLLAREVLAAVKADSLMSARDKRAPRLARS
jgi:hypothetical protein